MYLFEVIVVGKFRGRKVGDNQRKKFFINNSVEALILIKNEHCPPSLAPSPFLIWGENFITF